MLPTLSVVIPTHKRASILKRCLDHLSKQTIASQIEVIVVSDGRDNETLLMFDQPPWKMPVEFFEIVKSQQGVARNRGVEKAKAPIILFINDDIFLAPDACEKHLAAHKKHQSIPSPNPQSLSPHPIAVLGYTTWDPSLEITPAMQWLEKTGWQFGYAMLAPYVHAFVPREEQERFTYASNLSIPTITAKQYPFREDVTLYGWEDTLWGKQLKDAGVPLYYEPDASALHYHHITLGDSLERIETLGQSLLHLTKIDPDLGRMPTGWKLLVYKLIAMFPTMRGRHYKAFLHGMKSGNDGQTVKID